VIGANRRLLWVPLVGALAGCPSRVGPPPVSGAAVRPGELPGDVPGLIAYADAEYAKDQPLDVENSLVALDKARLTEPKSYDILWRGARAAAWLADDADGDKDRRARFAHKGIDYAKAAIDANPHRVEAPYYLAISIGLLATTKTLGAHELVPQVLKLAKDAVKMDEKFDYGGPLRLLGSVYVKAPSWPASVGDVDEGVKHLRRAVELGPDYPHNHLLYADGLVANNKLAEAEREYQAVLAAPSSPAWEHRLARWRNEAQEGLKKIQKKRSGGGKSTGEPF
jgi:hypothetical protein